MHASRHSALLIRTERNYSNFIHTSPCKNSLRFAQYVLIQFVQSTPRTNMFVKYSSECTESGNLCETIFALVSHRLNVCGLIARCPCVGRAFVTYKIHLIAATDYGYCCWNSYQKIRFLQFRHSQENASINLKGKRKGWNHLMIRHKLCGNSKHLQVLRWYVQIINFINR